MHRHVENVLNAQGIDELYQHQVTAIDAVRAEENVVVATPMASGKNAAVGRQSLYLPTSSFSGAAERPDTVCQRLRRLCVASVATSMLRIRILTRPRPGSVVHSVPLPACSSSRRSHRLDGSQGHTIAASTYRPSRTPTVTQPSTAARRFPRRPPAVRTQRPRRQCEGGRPAVERGSPRRLPEAPRRPL